MENGWKPQAQAAYYPHLAVWVSTMTYRPIPEVGGLLPLYG